MNDRLICSELAEKLRVKSCTVRAWQRQGMPYIPCGRLRFYNLQSVENWLRKREEERKGGKK